MRGTGVDPALITQFGAPVAFCLVLIAVVKVLFAREVDAHTRERERGDRLENELRTLNETVRERVVPALIEASRVNAEAGRTLGEVAAVVSMTRRGP